MIFRNAISLCVLGIGYICTANRQTTSKLNSAFTSAAPLPDGPKYEPAVLLAELNKWYVVSSLRLARDSTLSVCDGKVQGNLQ
jgi:hypothetical protein